VGLRAGFEAQAGGGEDRHGVGVIGWDVGKYGSGGR
jgi:hypothetical protein